MKIITNFIRSSKFKRFLILLFLLVLFIIISAFSYVNAISRDISENLFRLHVLANSDSEEDQNLKYLVRDNVIIYINTLSKNLTNKEDVIKLANENIDNIKKVAEDTIKENGYDYTVSIEIGNFTFPTKQYGDISFPAGFYDALRINIGEAKGQNWWCVMFPPLCFVDSSSGVVPESSKELMKESLTEEEYNLISNNRTDIKLKFKIVELFQNISVDLANL